MTHPFGSDYYNYRFVCRESPKALNGVPYQTHIYSFDAKAKNNNVEPYLVLIDYFPQNIMAFKFCREVDRGTDREYTHMSNTYDAGRKIATCLQIVKELADENPRATFAWVGARGDFDYSNRSTKRFRVWYRLSKKWFNPAKWRIRPFKEESACLIVRNGVYSDEEVKEIYSIANKVLT